MTKIPNYPWIDQGGLQQIAPEGLMPILEGFRISPNALPFRILALSIVGKTAANPTVTILMNSISSDLVITTLADGEIVIASGGGKAIFNPKYYLFLSTRLFLGDSNPGPSLANAIHVDGDNNNIMLQTLDSNHVQRMLEDEQNGVVCLIVFDLPVGSASGLLKIATELIKPSNID